MKKLFSIREAATLSFSKDIHFSPSLKGFEVSYCGKPSVSWEDSQEKANSEYQRGKQDLRVEFDNELSSIRNELANRQKNLLEKIQKEASATLEELENRLPELLINLIEHVLPGLDINAEAIETIVRSLIEEFADDTEALDVYLCPDDLKLLKGLKNPVRIDDEQKDDGGDDGFSKAISGIFDNLEGDDSLLSDYPNVSFHEDSTLQSGDCQIKSRFGLLDGRVATKLRRVKASMTQNG